MSETPDGAGGRAPVVPNESRVRGTLLDVRPDSSSGGSVWQIAVHEARDVQGMPNFAAAHVGKTITVYLHPELRTRLAVGNTLEARVSYRGDESGGRFALVADDVRRL